MRISAVPTRAQVNVESNKIVLACLRDRVTRFVGSGSPHTAIDLADRWRMPLKHRDDAAGRGIEQLMESGRSNSKKMIAETECLFEL